MIIMCISIDKNFKIKGWELYYGAIIGQELKTWLKHCNLCQLKKKLNTMFVFWYIKWEMETARII